MREACPANRHRLRIALVLPFASPGGDEEAMIRRLDREVRLAADLRSLGHQIETFKLTRSPDPLEFRDRLGGAWHYLPLDPHSAGRRNSEVMSAALLRAVVDGQPDVLLVKGAGTTIGAALAARSEAVLGIIIGGHRRARSIIDADVILTEDDDQDKMLRLQGLGPRILRLPKLPAPAFLEIATGERPTPKHDVAVVAKFDGTKNQGSLLPLFATDHSIIFVGDGPERSVIERAAATARARVTFTGQIPIDEVAAVVSRSRLLAHPARHEGFPRAIAEAMALGVPSVALRRVVGPPLVHGHNGLLVRERDLVPAIIELLDDTPRLERLGANARRTQREQFSSDALRRATFALDQRLQHLAGRPPARRAWSRGRSGMARARADLVELAGRAAARLRPGGP